MQTNVSIQCHFCFESFNIDVEALEEAQCFVEDCQICCRPLEINIEFEDGEVTSLRIDPSN